MVFELRVRPGVFGVLVNKVPKAVWVVGEGRYQAGTHQVSRQTPEYLPYRETEGAWFDIEASVSFLDP